MRIKDGVTLGIEEILEYTKKFEESEKTIFCPPKHYSRIKEMCAPYQWITVLKHAFLTQDLLVTSTALLKKWGCDYDYEPQ